MEERIASLEELLTVVYKDLSIMRDEMQPVSSKDQYINNYYSLNLLIFEIGKALNLPQE